MYDRSLKLLDHSYLILGPRGTGKSTWIRQQYPESNLIDLLVDETFTTLLANPDRVETYITKPDLPVLIDEVQKTPKVLNSVHRLIEGKGYRFILTGSSARKLKKQGVNLLAGRAYTKYFHALTVQELGADFNLQFGLTHGFLPSVYSAQDPKKYLSSYVATYLKEEVQQEGLVRNMANFARFLEAAAFSQGSVLNITNVATECGVERRTVTEYFQILEDLLLAYRLPVFTKRAKRKLTSHPKFYLFDCGVYQAARPKGPLDSVAEIEGVALETLVIQQVKATNEVHDLGYELSYWRTREKVEVDCIVYGERGFVGIEVKRSAQYNGKDLRGLKTFQKDYPEADLYLLYMGDEERVENGIRVMPVEKFLTEIDKIL